MRNRFAVIMMTLGVAALLAGCDRAADNSNNADGKAGNDAAAREAERAPAESPGMESGDRLAKYFAETRPDGARGVAEIKADAEGPDEVVVVGRIGGRVQPFLEGAAVFLLADLGMKHCGEIHGDTCPQPWDYCCEPKDSLMKNTATIQLVDDSGRPLKVDVKEKHGLEPLRILTIKGKVAQREAGGALVINAEKIYVEPA